MKSLAAVLAVAALAGAGAASAQSWIDNVTVKGNLRYRHEIINDDSKLDANEETYSRQRDRIRARLAAEAKVNDYAKAGLEISTGQSDPVSGNQTIGDGFVKKDFKLNLAYLDVNLLPTAPVNEFHLIGGKMKNPLINVADLVWDGDLTPEGAAVRSVWGLGDAVTLLGNGAYFWVQERSDKDDTFLYAGQGAVKAQFTPEVYLLAGATYYQYDNIEGVNVLDWEAKNGAYGNSTQAGSVSGSTTNKAYKTDFVPVELFAELGLWFIKGYPVTFYGQYLMNQEADDLDTGFLAGVSVGKAKNPRTLEVGYSYAELEKDATLGAFTDSDRWGGGTDGSGHKVYARYQILKNLQAGVTYFFANEKPISNAAQTKDYSRAQFDLVASF